mgnify:CR=1 FL=1
MHEVITKYGADETFVDLGCSVLKKLPCLDESGVLDVEGNTCETKVDACEDFDRQQIAQLTLPGRTKFNEEEFKKREINLHWQNYECKEYNQLFGDFIPYLSVVDLLFNHGEKAGEVI